MQSRTKVVVAMLVDLHESIIQFMKIHSTVLYACNVRWHTIVGEHQ